MPEAANMQNENGAVGVEFAKSLEIFPAPNLQRAAGAAARGLAVRWHLDLPWAVVGIGGLVPTSRPSKKSCGASAPLRIGRSDRL
jgi:hypothetical protein